ncbi:MAG TPA: ABC transporter permease [Thermodesulfobacteriota bacterium]
MRRRFEERVGGTGRRAAGLAPALAGGAVVLLLALAVPVSRGRLFGLDPDAMDLGAMLLPPQAGHLLGTDALGRDVLARVVAGAEASLLPGLLAVSVALALGVAAGVAAGYLAGSWVERVVNFALQLVDAVPRFVLFLVVVAAFKPSIFAIMAVAGVTASPGVASHVATRVRLLAARGHVEAARALGLTRLAIVGRHVLWNHCRPVVAIQASLLMGEAVLIETALSYLGFGVQEPAASWGNMVAMGKDHFFAGAFHLAVAPAAAIVVAVIGFHLLGDGLARAFERRRA